MGYIEPHELGMPRKEFQRLYNLWESKLKQSGFDDIEYRSPSHTGHFTPFFRRNGSTATFQALYDPAKEEYFTLCRYFDSEFEWSKAFKANTELYKTLWRLHMDGVPYRAIAKAFSGQPNKYMATLEPVPAKLHRPCSVFWAFMHMQKILNHFWTWAATQGFSDPRAPKAPPKPRKSRRKQPKPTKPLKSTEPIASRRKQPKPAV